MVEGESSDVFDHLAELSHMNEHIVDKTLVELRGETQANPRERLEKMVASNNREGGVSGVGGNSYIFFYKNGRVKEKALSSVGATYLRDKENRIPKLAVYRWGIEGQTADGRPIFQNPETSTMWSVAIEDADREKDWLQEPVEPLFNIDEDGTVLARISDQPTPTELQLFHDILERFEQ